MRGWTLRELERRTGISRAMLCRYENGQTSPNLEAVFEIAQAFNIRVCDLVPEVNGFR